MRIGRNLLLIIFSFLIISSCKKKKCEDSRGPSDAIFSLVKDGDSCGFYFIGGFMKGLSSDGTYLHTWVYITKSGYWNITTPVVNGISFSGSGNVTSTPNLQELTLRAQGAPVQLGTFIMPLVAGCSSCNFKFNVIDSIACSNLDTNTLIIYGMKILHFNGLRQTDYHGFFQVLTSPLDSPGVTMYFSGTTNHNNDWPIVGKYTMVDQLGKVAPFKVLVELNPGVIPLNGGEMIVGRNSIGATMLFCNVEFTNTYTDSSKHRVSANIAAKN